MKEMILPLLAVSLASLAVVWPTSCEAGELADSAAGQRISGPVTHENLTIYFIHGKSAEGPVPLTLDEALDKGLVTVHETGSVSELAIENTGKEDVLVHAGDIVKGGQQDRVLTTTMILKPGSGRVPLAAFCVEQGRWAQRGSEDVKRFVSAKEMMPSREAKLALKAKLKEQPGMAAGLNRQFFEPNVAVARRVPDAQGVEGGETARVQEQRPVRTAPGIDAQGEVWRSVAGIQAALSVNVGTKVNSEVSESSLQLALENDKVEAARKAYVTALEALPGTDGTIVGYAFAVNGKINSADVYASHALFRKLWPRLLKAAATEALGAKGSIVADAAPVPAAVEAFLAEAGSGKADEIEPAKGLKLKVRDNAKSADFETVGSDGAFVHRSVLAR